MSDDHVYAGKLGDEMSLELARLRADNLKLVAIIARNETHYQALRKLWVEACQERERIRAALQSLIKIGPRPWMDGGVSWAEWDAAMSAADAVAKEGKTDGR